MVLALKYSKAIFETPRPPEKRVAQKNYLYQLLFTADDREKERAHHCFIKNRFKLLMISENVSAETLALPICLGSLLMQCSQAVHLISIAGTRIFGTH